MFQKIAKHRANDASNDVHRPPLLSSPNDDRFLHWLASTRGSGRSDRLSLRSLHSRPQRQRPGGLQRGGEEVSKIHNSSVVRWLTTYQDVFSWLKTSSSSA